MRWGYGLMSREVSRGREGKRNSNIENSQCPSIHKFSFEKLDTKLVVLW